MITRIEIDGFKSFVDFSLDLHPFTTVIGTNASGKSNLIDAFRFLSAAVERSVYDAVDTVRGDAESLFHQYADGSRADSMRFAVEFLVEPREDPAEDLLGLDSTRWRYDAEIGWADEHARDQLVFRQESLTTRVVGDSWFDFVGAAEGWSAAHRRTGLDHSLELRRANHRLTVPPGYELLVTAVLNDLVSLRSCAFETTALRRISRKARLRELSSDGSGLPGYLAGLRELTAEEQDDTQGVLRVIGMVLHGIIPDVTGFEVIEDEDRRDVRIVFTSRNEPAFEAEIASSGTLRTLAMLAVLADPRQTAPILVDEPENGLYPSRLRRLVKAMRQGASDPATDGPDAPLRQVIIAGHSPVVLDDDEVRTGRIIFLDVVDRVGQGRASRVTRARRTAPTAAKDSTSDRGALSAAAVARLRSGTDGLD